MMVGWLVRRKSCASCADGAACTALVVIYQILFWFIVITIMLNVVFGIILDAFAELRGNDQARKEDMENVCFICGLGRFTFDTQGNGFDKHIEEEHNMWH